MRPTAISTALLLLAASLCAPAQDTRLPDFGSSAGRMLAPAQEAEYGRMLLAQLRHYDYVLEDPLIDGWLRQMGNRIGAASDKPEQSFTFFMMRDRQVNAFATLGGYIGMNAGLVLIAESEDEVASVLAHEAAHVTQSHVLRGAERAQRDSVPVLLAMLGAIALAQQSSSNSAGNGAMAVIASAQGLMIQRQIDYTRSNESEADRLGMRTLARSGYDTGGMAKMFERMQAISRANQGGPRERTPDYLRTHPVTTTRIAEAKERASHARGDRFTPTAGSTGNPLLPSGLQLVTTAAAPDARQFGWARERLRVLSANTPSAAIREYEQMGRAGPLTDAQQYGLALARMRDNQGGTAVAAFETLLRGFPQDPWIALGHAESLARAGRHAEAGERFDALVARMPTNRAVVLAYADVLGERATPEAGRRAQAILRPIHATSADDPNYQRAFARASDIAGDPVRAGEAWAEAAYLGGREEQALIQLNTLKRRDDLDYYARARIDARIAAITPVVLELRRQGIHDPDLRRQ